MPRPMARVRFTEYRERRLLHWPRLPTGDSRHLAALKVEQEEAGGLECVLRVTGRERSETGSEVKELYLVWKKPEYVFHTEREPGKRQSSRQRNGDKHDGKGGEGALNMGGAVEKESGPLGSLLPNQSTRKLPFQCSQKSPLGHRLEDKATCEAPSLFHPPSVPFPSSLPTSFRVCGSRA